MEPFLLLPANSCLCLFLHVCRVWFTPSMQTGSKRGRKAAEVLPWTKHKVTTEHIMWMLQKRIRCKGDARHLPRLPALAWNEYFPSFCQLRSFMLTLHILYWRSTPMLSLAQLNYLLRHSGGNRTAGSADLRAPFQRFVHSATGRVTSASGLVCGPLSGQAVLDLTFC